MDKLDHRNPAALELLEILEELLPLAGQAIYASHFDCSDDRCEGESYSAALIAEHKTLDRAEAAIADAWGVTA